MWWLTAGGLQSNWFGIHGARANISVSSDIADEWNGS